MMRNKKWIDRKIDNGYIREIGKIKLYFNDNGNKLKIEGQYNFVDFPISDIDYKYNDKIGTLDF
jgi:hypothetical protein